MSYKDHIRQQVCLACHRYAEPHHLATIGMGSNRNKATWRDFASVPLCRIHHSELHQIGISKFEDKYKINLYKEALFILAKWIFNKEK